MNELDFDHDERSDEQADERERPFDETERGAKPAIEPFDPFFRKRTRDEDYNWA
jgi:hypothetical protein